MRRKDQTARRRQLVEAARQVLLERGAVGVRVKDIAERAGLAPSSVLYYYPRLDALLLEVSREAINRYGVRRADTVRALSDPTDQLRLTLHLGVPTGPDDEQSRLLYELDAFTGSSPAFAVLTASYFDRQVMLYQTILERGASRGDFRLAAGAELVARGLVALEDGLGLQVVLGHPALDAAEAERILVSHAGAMTATDLTAVPVAAGGAGMVAGPKSG